MITSSMDVQEESGMATLVVVGAVLIILTPVVGTWYLRRDTSSGGGTYYICKDPTPQPRGVSSLSAADSLSYIFQVTWRWAARTPCR